MLIRTKYLTAFITIFIFLGMLAVSSCTRDSDLGEYKVPDTYTVFKDKNGLYSISIPSDWKQVDYPEASDSINTYWTDSILPGNLQKRTMWRLFDAEKMGLGGAFLHVTRLHQEELTKEQLYIFATQDLKANEHLKEILRIDGREMAIFENAYLVQSVVIVNKWVWVTNCTGGDRDNKQKDLHIIARSLRILK